ncbi:unnamed protein product [Didymodactylos carnosus]|uniref:TIR domain-containing protein n=1 Tax=Didymodactylos carnosus TaxID=1234261 RepID=A0A814G3T5_9BILA|nr:unnamed protein product [Didymodactylos carnosus]CAF3764969.1 unnamed protein product [Didymodactylos carnosus]
MDLLLNRCSFVFRQLRKEQTPIRAVNIKEIFNEIVSFLNTIDNQSNGLNVIAIVCNELASVNTLKIFDDPVIIKHPLIIIIGRTFEMLLTKWNYEKQINMEEVDQNCLYETSYLIAYLCLYRNGKRIGFYTNEINEISYQKIFLTTSFFDKVARLIKDLSNNEYEPYSVKYKVADRLVRLCRKLNESDVNLDSVIDATIECLSSRHYLTVFQNIDLKQPTFNPKQSFFIRECSDFIIKYTFKQQHKVSYNLSKIMLEYNKLIFKKHLPVTLEGEVLGNCDRNCVTNREPKGARMNAIGCHIKLLNYFALLPSIRNDFIPTAEATNHIIDKILDILSTNSLIESIMNNQQAFHVDVSVISYSITLLYNLVFHRQLFSILKANKRLLDICLRLQMVKDRSIHFVAQTLSKILVDQTNIDDIKQPRRIAKAYLYYIENTVDEPTQTHHGIKLDGVFTNLTTIIQNDEVKNTIAEDEEGLQLIAKCAYDEKFDHTSIQLPALDVVWSVIFTGSGHKAVKSEVTDISIPVSRSSSSLSQPVDLEFEENGHQTQSVTVDKHDDADHEEQKYSLKLRKKAVEVLNDDEQFMKHVTKLSTSRNIKEERTANGILWRLSNEKAFIRQKQEEEKKEKQRQQQRRETPKTKFVESEAIYQYVNGDYRWNLSESKPIHGLTISYSYNNKELCYKIYNTLQKSKFYRVWIGKENVYGSLPKVMAEKIENSRIVLICMSTGYRASQSCQAEAEYAWKRDQSIIPLIVERDYNPSGWLKAIIGDRKSIDFTQIDFDASYLELINEIDKTVASDSN